MTAIVTALPHDFKQCMPIPRSFFFRRGGHAEEREEGEGASKTQHEHDGGREAGRQASKQASRRAGDISPQGCSRAFVWWRQRRPASWLPGHLYRSERAHPTVGGQTDTLGQPASSGI